MLTNCSEPLLCKVPWSKLSASKRLRWFEVLIQRLWRYVPFKLNFSEAVCKGSGVYIVASTRLVHSFPVQSEVFYVGRGRSVRARFEAHLDHTRSHNDRLYSRIFGTPSSDPLMFWFCEAPEQDIGSLEIDLIRTLQPKDNKQMYGSGHD